MDTALLCECCAWSGVFRREVTERLMACPSCGTPHLSSRAVGDQRR